MARPLVALLSDFGTRDHYAGALKAVVLGVCPDATLVDISHDIPPHDVLAAALELGACYRYFAAGTIFLAVVDPGVGSQRRGIAADTGDFKFVGPDNGVFSVVFRETPPKRVVELTERKYARPTVSRTFEGRDRFAPAAGWLAKGINLGWLGKSVTDFQLLEMPQPRAEDGEILGVVVRVDRFGNLVSNIDHRTFDQLARQGPIVVRVGTHEVARVVGTYAEAAAGELCALFGGTDHLEIALNAGHAAAALGLTRGADVTVRRGG